MCVDNSEETCFIGSGSGKIFTICLLNPPRNVQYNPESLTSAIKFVGHEKAVTCLSISMDGSLLLSGLYAFIIILFIWKQNFKLTFASGSDDMMARVWDIHSGQCVRLLQHRGPLSNAFFCPKFKHFDAEKFQPRTILSNFEKKLDNQLKAVADVLIDETPFKHEMSHLFADTNEDLLLSELKSLRKINHELYSFALDSALQACKQTAEI